MTKAARQAKLLQIVRSGEARTQTDMSRRLADYGIDVSQVTLSRDIRDLGLVKSADGYREGSKRTPVMPSEAMVRVLREFLTSVRTARNLVVAKTRAGGASVVASALDGADWPEVAGTVAGDDTIFLATSSDEDAVEVAERMVGAVEGRGEE